MNTKKLAVLFCVLFASSFVQAWVDGRESLKANSLRHESPLLKLLGGIEDHLGGSNDLAQSIENTPRLTTNPVTYYGPSSNPNVLAMCDPTGGNVLILDFDLELALFCNGAGTAVIVSLNVNISDVTAVYVPIGAWNKTSSTSLISFIDNVDLSVLLSLSNNTTVDQSNPSNDVLNICLSVFGALSLSVSQAMSANLNLSLQIAIGICVEIFVAITGTLNGLVSLVTTVAITINGGLSALLEILGGLVDLCVKASIDVQALVSANVVIALEVIIASPDGITALVNVCLTLGANIDLSVLLQACISDIVIFLNLCVRLGGGLYVGITGVVRIIVSILTCLESNDATTLQTTLEACLLVIVRVCVNLDVTLDISASLAACISLINDQISKYNSSASEWTYLNTIIVNLQSGTYVTSQGVDISAILSLCLTGIVDTALVLVVNIILEICVYVNVSLNLTVNLYFATLLKVVLNLLNDITGRICLNLLFPTLGLTINVLDVCLNLLGGLSLTIAVLIANISLLGLLVSLALVPVLNIIINGLSVVILAQAGLSLSDCINASECATVKADITAWANGIDDLGC